MRRRARTDRNQAEIMRALRAVGATVADTSKLGGGFPDLVCGFRAENYLFEVKDGTLSPSRRALTEDEAEFHGQWRGTVQVVCSVDEALRAIGALT